MKKSDFKATPNIEKIRLLSGMIGLSGDNKRDVARLVNILALICLITRVEMGDADEDFLLSQIDKMFGPDEDEKTEVKDDNEAGSN